MSIIDGVAHMLLEMNEGIQHLQVLSLEASIRLI
jgi:hypothetical protein